MVVDDVGVVVEGEGGEREDKCGIDIDDTR